METLCALFISAHHTARGTKSSTCQAVPSCSQPSLTESIYCWPASGLTFWAVLYNDDRRGSMSLLCASVANPALSQEQAHGEGSAVREEQLRACPCSLCGLLHSVAFRAPVSSVQRAAPSPHTCGAAGISAARSPCPPSQRRFPDGQEDTDGALCSREARHRAPRHSPALAGSLPAWLRVPRAVWEVQLSASQGMEALQSCPRPVKFLLAGAWGEWEPRTETAFFRSVPALSPAAPPGMWLLWHPWLAVGCDPTAPQVTELELLHLCLCWAYVQMMWAYLNLFKDQQQTHKIKSTLRKEVSFLCLKTALMLKKAAAGQSSDGLSDTPGRAGTYVHLHRFNCQAT